MYSAKYKKNLELYEFVGCLLSVRFYGCALNGSAGKPLANQNSAGAVSTGRNLCAEKLIKKAGNLNRFPT